MPYDIIRKFEQTIADFSNARYGVAASSCTNALFLSCYYMKVKKVLIPKFTYPGVACSILHAGGRVRFRENGWSGAYKLFPYEIWDSALRFKPNMYVGGLYCLSFHIKKRLPIGRGGMILTDNKDAAEWLRRARFDGRRECALKDDSLDMLGWNMYMTPEQAARGLQLFSLIKNFDDLPVEEQGYPDLSKFEVYKK
jgi:dTDP-4-amino-4,6-dideoxygalactose transaminase